VMSFTKLTDEPGANDTQPARDQNPCHRYVWREGTVSASSPGDWDTGAHSSEVEETERPEMQTGKPLQEKLAIASASLSNVSNTVSSLVIISRS
jgi:hypothetical protein